MIDFMSGAVTLAYLLGAVFFLRFWQRTKDRLFLTFSIAFGLFGLNQTLAFLLGVAHEPSSFIYALRVLGFLLILAGIVDKNLHSSKAPRRPVSKPDIR